MHIPLGPLAGPLGRDLRASALRDAATIMGDRVHDDLATMPVVTDDDIAGLPDPAQRYLRSMGVVGQSRDRNFLVRFTGRFKRRPGQPWMPCEAWQFNSAAPLSRVFHMRIDVAHLVPMIGRDSYLDGHGAMKGKVVGLVTVADGSGDEFDLGELVTYLNDALLLAPSMLLDRSTTWTSVDDRAFDVAIEDRGHRVTARVSIDSAGLMRDFATEDRWCDLPSGLVRARWTTPIDGWTVVDGRLWPTGASAVWHLPDGPLPYIEGAFDPDSIVRDLDPSRDTARRWPTSGARGAHHRAGRMPAGDGSS